METSGIVTTEQILEYTRKNGGFLKIKDSINSELSLKSMLTSCFVYGGINKDSWNFEKYIAPYKDKMTAELFESIYSEMSKHFEGCTIITGVYTDHEGCTYNSIVEN